MDWDGPRPSTHNLCDWFKSWVGTSKSDQRVCEKSSRSSIKLHPPSFSRFLGTVEFLELFGQDEDAMLEVSITGEWYTKPEINIFTNEPTTCIAVDPERVVYGPSSNKADDWSSLGPIKRLDLLYLSKDIMISRGNVNPESLFVWQRM